jgi:hypothetical protein
MLRIVGPVLFQLYIYSEICVTPMEEFFFCAKNGLGSQGSIFSARQITTTHVNRSASPNFENAFSSSSSFKLLVGLGTGLTWTLYCHQSV